MAVFCVFRSGRIAWFSLIRRIVSSTDAYIRKFAIDLPVRFDIITLVGQEAPFEIEHIEEAFYPPIW